jgi:hypothetical protein
MGENDLIKDLKNLNKRYLDLEKELDNLLITPQEYEKIKKLLIKKGELIINFYNDIFVPKYSQNSGEVFLYVKDNLENLYDLASNHISKKSLFCLDALLHPKGKIGDSNSLEELIQYLKNSNQ